MYIIERQYLTHFINIFDQNIFYHKNKNSYYISGWMKAIILREMY